MTTAHIIKLSVQAAFLLSSLILCAWAAALSFHNPSRRFRLTVGLAAIALSIGIMGVWASISFLPGMGFSWQFANGWHVVFDFRWCFILPLLLALGTCVTIIRRQELKRISSDFTDLICLQQRPLKPIA